MTLTVLSVAYPLAPVSPDAVGGAEQVLSILDRALVRRGHRSLVIAPEGSRVDGTLIPVPVPAGTLDERVQADAQARHALAIRDALARCPVDLVHLHGVDFARYWPPPGPPVLATLHLPVGWYGADALHPARPDTWLHGVSATQMAGAAPNARMLPPIPNGIDLAAFPARTKRRFALVLGRICPEKGVHLALDAARAADMPLALAGRVFPYETHRLYFEDEVRPRLDRRRRFLGAVGGRRKARLLASASCLLVPSLAPETSSLVAREAAAAGTPAIAFRAGALVETVEHGRTGFLVDDAAGMADAMGRVGAIDPAVCRAVARERFGAEPMIDAYLALYGRLARGRAA